MNDGSTWIFFKGGGSRHIYASPEDMDQFEDDLLAAEEGGWAASNLLVAKGLNGEIKVRANRFAGAALRPNCEDDKPFLVSVSIALVGGEHIKAACNQVKAYEEFDRDAATAEEAGALLHLEAGEHDIYVISSELAGWSHIKVRGENYRPRHRGGEQRRDFRGPRRAVPRR